MAEWDDDNFEPQLVKGGGEGGGILSSNRWEGEDEDDDVKDNWEDEEEEKKTEEINDLKAKAKKKTLADRIAEREKIKREEYEKRILEEEPEITPEEQLRRQQESDLKLALETTFGGDNNKDLGQPKTKEEYQELADTFTKNIQQYSKSDEYPTFAENIIRGVCTTLTSFDLKKIKTTIDNLYLEKQKIEKGDKAKKTKGKGKAKLRMEGDNPNLYSSYVTTEYDEYDDFM